MKHLTDHEIQSYVVGVTQNKTELENHISLCRYCQNQLAIYKMIFSELKTDIGTSFSPNFAQSVIAQIEAARERKINFIESCLLAAAIMIGLVLTWYYVDLKPISEFFAEGYHHVTDYSRSLSFVPQIPSNWLDANSSLILLAGVILILAGLLDSFISRHKFSIK